MKNKLVIPISTILIVLIVTYVFPWRKINWGTLRIGPERTVTVTGTSSSTETNQVANFSAGVTVSNDVKETAVSEVETKMQALVTAVKEFGIEDKDIKTESVSVYQREDMITEGGIRKSEPGQWRASSNISIKLRDTDRATELTSLITRMETTNVYGPNFSIDDTQDIETSLLESAIEDAREKAEKIAKAQGEKLGKIITVAEGAQSAPVFARMEAMSLDGSGGMPMEPGSSKISKTVTVTFGLK